MKELLNKLNKHSVEDPHSSILGTLAGLPDVVQGIIDRDCVTLIKGIAIIFLGLITKSNK